MKDKISIIIPTYNEAKYISECLDSILSQDYPINQLEVIIVDDCSTDGTTDILAQYEEAHPNEIMIIRLPEHMGFPGKSRNIGMSYASGDYITFIDSDDTISNNFISYMYELIACEDYDFCSCSYDLFTDTEWLNEDIFPDSSYDFSDITSKKNYILTDGMHTDIHGRIYKRVFIENYNIKFADMLHIAEDCYFQHQCMMYASKVRLSSKVLYHYRIKDNSLFHNTSSNHLSDMYICMNNLTRLFADNHILDNVRKEYEAIYYLKAYEEAIDYAYSHSATEEEIYTLSAQVRNVLRTYYKDINTNPYLSENSKQKLDLLCPAISVIIPVYNSIGSINKCVSSLISQSFSSLEILLINDCSTDDTLLILNEWSRNLPDKIHVYSTPTNLGAGGARNLGVEYANGQYIGFVDSDDYVQSSMFEKLYMQAINGNFDVVDCGFYDEKKDNAIIFTSDDLTGDLDNQKRSKLIVSGGYIWSKLFDYNLFADKNMTMRENCILEDSDFLTYVFSTINRIGNVKEILYFYSNQEDSLSKQNNTIKYHENICNAVDAIYKKTYTLLNYEDVRLAIEYEVMHMLTFGILNLAKNASALGNEKINTFKLELIKLKESTIGTNPSIYSNPYVLEKIPDIDLNLFKKTELAFIN